MVGDTTQDSEEFSFEFLVVTRGIMAGDVVINPKYLLLGDCLEELVELLPEDQRQIYEDDYKLHISKDNSLTIKDYCCFLLEGEN